MISLEKLTAESVPLRLCSSLVVCVHLVIPKSVQYRV